jgi:hypothetical protein
LSVSRRKANVGDHSVVPVERIDSDGHPRQDAVIRADAAEGPAPEGWRFDSENFEADHFCHGIGRQRRYRAEDACAKGSNEPYEAQDGRLCAFRVLPGEHHVSSSAGCCWLCPSRRSYPISPLPAGLSKCRGARRYLTQDELTRYARDDAHSGELMRSAFKGRGKGRSQPL